ncbi:uncharacterized protein LOC143359421 [Halictus rubicundus]|uniref:uncharacterized protein LOC143359421 n=1 Tax=Halictus rubicundus TaxID=77578 RepID=UPI0040366FE4
MTPATLILLVLLTPALSIITNHGTPSKEDSAAPLTLLDASPDQKGPREEENQHPIETLFIPEDPNRYATIFEQVRELLERADPSKLSENVEPNAIAGDSVDEATNAEPEETKLSEETVRNSLENTSRWEPAPENTTPDQFSNKSVSLEIERNSSLSVENHLPRNPDGLSERTAVWDNEDDGAVFLDSVGEDPKDKETTEPGDEDLLEAANFGLQAMKQLYFVTEPTLYSMGLYLDSDNPAKYVAAFNDQTEEARALAKYGFAVLQSTTMFKKKFPDAPTDSLLLGRSQSNPLQRHCPNRGVPECPPASLRYRTSDGSCNNLQNLWWGSAMSPMNRFLSPIYGDGVQSVRRSISGSPLPSARDVTRIIHEDRDVPLASVTHMLMQWGQFVDHDITATGQSRGFNGTIPQCCLNFGTGFQPPEFMHPECLPISVSVEDSFFGPLGVKCLEFLRSGPAPREDCKFGPREQLSQVTSYLDASTVYSSNAFQTDTLRLFRNGLLQYGKLQSQRPVLPKQDSDLCRRGSLSTNCFRAGDGRLGEQPALTSIHVVFLRLHNRIATKLAALNPHWNDEKLFQESRRIVGAVTQHITYREFLPIVLGLEVMKIFDLEVRNNGYYEGYDPSVNPTVANGFAAAAYRFGHSLVQHSFVRFNSDHQPIFNNVTIHREFSTPANLETAGSVDRLLLGLINQPSQKRDEHISEELTNHLFQTPRFPFGMDLASINIQRGRDHGIPPYVHWREPCGLSSIKSFEDLDRVMPSEVVLRFRQIYSFVEDIDLFTAGLAEKSVNGGLVGPTFACIIGQQFSNLRKGDRFWYENPDQESSFTPGQLQQIRRVSLALVLCRTMDEIETIQPFVFLTQDTMRNQRVSCQDPILGHLDLDFWREGPPEGRGRGILDSFKKKKNPAQSSTMRTTTKSQIISLIGDQSSKSVLQKGQPTQTSIYQNNKIVIRKPLGPPENVSIVVQNNAVNAPVFVKDGIFGSSVKTDPLKQQGSLPSRPSADYVHNRPVNQPPRPSVDYGNDRPINQPSRPSSDYVNDRPISLPPRPSADYVNDRPISLPPRPSADYVNDRPISLPPRPSPDYVNDRPLDHGPLQHIPIHAIPKPIPTVPPPLSQTVRPYVPHAYNDPSNPNPPSQGYQSNYMLNDVLFDSYSGSSPRPTLYTYYTNYQRPVTQRPYQDYINDRPQYHDPRPPVNPWPSYESQYQNNAQYTSKPLYGRPGSQYGSGGSGGGGGYPLNWQDLQQQSLVNQLTDPGHLNQDYGSRPKPYVDSLRDTDWHQNERYGTVPRPGDLRPDRYEYSTWSSVSSYQDRDRYDSNRPYQANRRPVQADPDGWSSIPTYQKDRPGPNYQSVTSRPIDRRTTESLFLMYSSQRPFPEPIKNSDYHRPNRPHHGDAAFESSTTGRPSYDNHNQNRFHQSTQRPMIQDRWGEPAENSYHNHARPKPSKVHSVTIVTEAAESASHDGYQGWEHQVTTEVPRPLVTQITGNSQTVRRPGQYYYEKNVLHRYPDKIEIQATTHRHFPMDDGVAQRHNVLETPESTDVPDVDDSTVVERSGNETKVAEVTNATRNETKEDATTAGSAGGAAGTVVIRTSYWLTPQEDSSLPSAPEVPKMPTDQAAAAKELPKPIKPRNYAS